MNPSNGGRTTTADPPHTPPKAPLPHRIRASKTVQGNLSLDDVSSLQNDIIRVLHDGGGEVTVTITVEASKADGFDEGVIRPVRDNSGQLGLNFDAFDTQ